MKFNKDLFNGIIIGVLVTTIILYIPVHRIRLQEARIDFILECFENGYYKELSKDDIQDMKDHLYAGLFSKIDRFSKYYTAKECQEEIENTTTNFGGIGVKVKYSEEIHNFVVTHVLDGTPASEKGIKINDIIEEIDGIPLTSIELTELNGLLRGKVGSNVTLKIQRENEHFDVDLTREEINYPSTRCEILNNVGYIKVYSFASNTDEELNDILQKLDKVGIDTLIIDLRDNLGGLSETTLDMCSILFPSGVLYKDIFKDGKVEEHRFKSNIDKCKYKIYVLVNHESASCSEIFASYISEHNLGTVIGETTYGKGVTQQFIEFKDGTGLQYTHSYWETEGGTNFLNRGLTPDIYCKDDYEDYLNFDVDRSNDRMLDFVLDLIEDSE